LALREEAVQAPTDAVVETDSTSADADRDKGTTI
jgi:hypothetical protein